MDTDNPQDTGLDAVKEHQAHHCLQILQLDQSIKEVILALQIVTKVLIRKGVISPADLLAEAESDNNDTPETSH